MKYNWSGYYRKAYEKKKKENILLAGKVADAEGKREELQAKYAAICGNPLYKMVQLFSLVKRGCGKAVRKAKNLRQGDGGIFSGDSGGSGRKDSSGFGGKKVAEKATSEELLKVYTERLVLQRDGYSQWIREEEPVLWRQCREALDAEKSGAEDDRRRNCYVVSYRELANITDLSQITGTGKKEQNSGEKSREGKCLREKETEPDILLLAEDPGDLDEKAVSYIEDWFMVHPETKLFYGAEDHRFPGGCSLRGYDGRREKYSD